MQKPNSRQTDREQTRKTNEKKDVDQLPKAHAGASGPETDNTSAGSGGRGGHRRRKGGRPNA